MARVRVVMNFMVAGALLAVLLVSWAGPKYINWNNTAGSGSGTAMCLCPTQALYGAQQIISYQMTGCAVGAVLGLILGITWVVLRRNKVAAAAAT